MVSVVKNMMHAYTYDLADVFHSRSDNRDTACA